MAPKNAKKTLVLICPRTSILRKVQTMQAPTAQKNGAQKMPAGDSRFDPMDRPLVQKKTGESSHCVRKRTGSVHPLLPWKRLGVNDDLHCQVFS